jgi:hypothetical protein
MATSKTEMGEAAHEQLKKIGNAPSHMDQLAFEQKRKLSLRLSFKQLSGQQWLLL